MTIPIRFLSASDWQKIPVGYLQVAYREEDELEPGVDIESASAGYRPASMVPKIVVCRVSDSEKRLEGPLQSVVSCQGPWGSIYEVRGHGAQLGYVMTITPGFFCGAHALPDVVHFVTCAEEIPADSLVKDVFDGKVFRLFRVGPMDDRKPHDFILSAKVRWFRTKHNPRHLGLVKEDRV